MKAINKKKEKLTSEEKLVLKSIKELQSEVLNIGKNKEEITNKNQIFSIFEKLAKLSFRLNEELLGIQMIGIHSKDNWEGNGKQLGGFLLARDELIRPKEKLL